MTAIPLKGSIKVELNQAEMCEAMQLYLKTNWALEYLGSAKVAKVTGKSSGSGYGGEVFELTVESPTV